MSAYIIELQAIGEGDSDAAGHKAANLASLLAAGFPIPSGCCLTTAAFRRALAPFRDRISTALSGGDLTEPERPAEAAHTIEQVLADLALPDDVTHELDIALARFDGEHVGVRSSATMEDL